MKIDIDFPDAVHEALHAAASAQGLSLNALVVSLLEAALAAHDPAIERIAQFVNQEFV